MQLVRSGIKLAEKMLISQVVLTVVAALLFFLVFDLSKALSVAIGGTVSVLTNAIYAFFTFRISGGSKYQLVYRNIKSGRKAKLSLTIILMLIFLQIPPIEKLELVLGFCIAVLVQYPVSYFCHRAQQRARS